MTLSRSDFAAFFAAVNCGVPPFAWQERLLDHLLDHGRWPGRITAPTGAGKTSVIDVHVFATALTAATGGPRLPRRLAMVVGRRVVVDDQHERALALAAALRAALTDRPPGDVIAHVAEVLLTLRFPGGAPTSDEGPGWDRAPLVVARLRGGAAPARSWRDQISACAVICATPDMWGSRLLFRGYGTSGPAAPREAGVLAFDAAVVVDEAHLSGQLLVTARRVSQLATVAEAGPLSVPVLQVVETTATPAGGTDPDLSVGVDEGDLALPVLGDRLTRPKPVTLLPLTGWPPVSKPTATAKALIEAVLGLLRVDHPARIRADLTHTVGCFVNSVGLAVAATEALRSRQLDGRAMRVVMVCGQTRPADLQRLTGRYPGLLTPAGNGDVDVIVSTQSLEVGVDLDLAALVTELAPGSALAQRAGRANRRGLRPAAPVIVAVPAEQITEKTRSGPYQADELAAALAWLQGRAQDPSGLAPWALRAEPPPMAPRRRTLYQRPELADAWHWARTSDDLAAEPELHLWLSESFEEDAAIGIVVRDAIPPDMTEAIPLIRDLPPRPHEAFPVPYGTARRALTRVIVNAVPAVRIRGEDVTALGTRLNDRAEPVADVRPGDLVVVDSTAAIFTGGAVDGGFSPYVVVDEETASTADDVLHHRIDPRAGVVLRLDFAGHEGATVAGISSTDLGTEVKELSTGLQDATGERERRDAVTGFLDALLAHAGACSPDARPMVEAARQLMSQPVKASDVLPSWDEDGELLWVLVVDRRRAGTDETLRQVFSTRPEGAGPVTLPGHQSAVAARARRLARAAGLAEPLLEALQLAGAHHDDGKADPRFQTRLGARRDELLLAKSDPASTARQTREREALARLPRGWRHEQLSVLSWLAAARSRDQQAPDVDPELITRLVGTSHGYGRSGFPHTSTGLLDVADSLERTETAMDWFDRGGWDELIERTQLRYGVWGCAYLEALLRSADGQVSGEGS